jgi:hypothetical protein
LTFGFKFKFNSGGDPILFVSLHVLEHLLGTLLIDLDLNLDDHVVDQSDVSSKTAVVSLGELLKLVPQGILLSFLGHAFIFVSLTSLTLLEVFLLAGNLLFLKSLDQGSETVGDIVNALIVGALALDTPLLLL